MRIYFLFLIVLNTTNVFAQSSEDVEQAFIDTVFELLELREGECPPDSEYNYRCATGTSDKQGIFQFNDLLLKIEVNASSDYTQFAFKQKEIDFEYPVALGHVDFVEGGSVNFIHQTSPEGSVLVIFAPSL